MTTTVKVTAHNFPAVVTVTSQFANVKTKSSMTLKDGEEHEFTVTDTQWVKVVEQKRATKE